jgi:hypothetical protein
MSCRFSRRLLLGANKIQAGSLLYAWRRVTWASLQRSKPKRDVCIPRRTGHSATGYWLPGYWLLATTRSGPFETVFAGADKSENDQDAEHFDRARILRETVRMLPES